MDHARSALDGTTTGGLFIQWNYGHGECPLNTFARPRVHYRMGYRTWGFGQRAKSEESACFLVVGGTGIEPVTPAV